MSLRPHNAENDAAACLKQGLELVRSGRYYPAMVQFRRAVELDPHCENGFRNLAFSLRDCGYIAEAGAAAARGLEYTPDDTVLCMLLAESLRHQGRVKEAIAYAEKAVALDPDDGEVYANLALLFADMGDKEKAAEIARRAIGIDPLNSGAHGILAHSIRYVDSADAHIMQMLKILSEEKLDIAARAGFCFALGKAFDDIGDCARAFSHFREGNKLIRSTIKFSQETSVHNFRQFAMAADVNFSGGDTGAAAPDGPVPVFIVGMPRSGTTLVEQILASHPEVYGAGELAALNNIQFYERSLKPARYAEQFSRLDEREISDMRAYYMKELTRNAPTGKRFITDKMPLNFRFIPLIRRLFPQAKIVHCRRDPRDTCFSVYRTYFGSSLPFAYDLEELAAYYRQYEKLMKYFEGVYGGAIYTVRYEDMVDDVETQTRRLLDFCGMGWSDSCLDYHKNDRTAVTASNYQVRQPIYRHAIGYWRKYEQFLVDCPFFDLAREAADQKRQLP